MGRGGQTASHWGVYTVKVDPSGRIEKTDPFVRDPEPSPLNRGLPELVNSDLRIDQPYVREGYLRHRGKGPHNRGGEPFIAIPWDLALDLIASELTRVKDCFGNEAIHGGSYGWASAGRLHHSQSVLKRFLGLHGGFVDNLGNHSYGAALGIMPYVTGRADIMQLMMPWPHIIDQTRLIVMFGGAHLKNAQIDPGGAPIHENTNWFSRASKAKIHFVNISPSRQDLTETVTNEWLPIRPNTDTAFMLGLAHTLAAEALHDKAFLESHCVGYARFEEYLLGRNDGIAKDADWAAQITGIDSESIRSLARRMASTRTLITTSWSVQRADHGEQPVWMTVVLASMLGQIGLPGGGFSVGFIAMNGIAAPRPEGIPRPTLPLGPNAVKKRIPVARVTEMLLHPGTDLQYNGETIRLPDIKLVYSVGGNPFHHNSNLNRFLQAWQRPDTIIVHEPWWTPPAKYADIVLPATTTLERNDILAAELSRFYIAMRKVVDPYKGARNDFDIFAALADKLGFATAFTEGRDEMGWLRHMYDGARGQAREKGFAIPTFDEFWAAGYYEFEVPDKPVLPFADFRADPVKSPLRTASGRIEIFSKTIDEFGYSDCLGHPAWLEPAEWLGNTLAGKYPLHLLSNQPTARLHSQLDPSELSRATKVGEREPIQINRKDAKARGIRTGDIVRVFNDRGAFIAGAILVDHLRPGVVQIATGAWYDPAEPGVIGSLEKHGNPNVVTLDKGTSRLAQASAAQTVLVEIARCSDAPPTTAFELPPFLSDQTS